MFIDVDNRCTGKTTTLIHDAYFSGLPIITLNVTRKNNLIHQAQTMGMGVVKVYTVSEIKDFKGNESLRDCGVLVDELEDVLNYALGGVKVVKANMSRRGSV